MTRAATLSLLALGGLLMLAGCDQLDPMMRTDRWQPSGANAGNLAAMVADPHDLIRGRGDIFRDSNDQALAVTRIDTDQAKAFSGGGGSSGGSSGGGGSGSSGGSSGGAPPAPGS